MVAQNAKVKPAAAKTCKPKPVATSAAYPSPVPIGLTVGNCRVMEAAQICGFSRSHYLKLHKEGKTPKSFKVSGGITVWRRSEVIEFAAKLTQGGV